MDGLILVDKSSGGTSHDVVARCRYLLRRKDIGHTGTLDPFASGLMILLLGEATKLSSFFTESDKSYRARVFLGQSTDTLDLTGVSQGAEYQGAPPSLSLVKEALAKATGSRELPIPIYSAKKVNGKKLCDLARKNEKIVPPQKLMNFYNIHLDSYEWPYLDVSLSCTKGSFIRSWSAFLGELLNTGAHLHSLRRTKTLSFTVEAAKSLPEIEKIVNENSGLESIVQPVEGFVQANKTVMVRGRDQKLLRNGQVSYDLRRRLIEQEKQAQFSGESQTIKVLSYPSKKILAMLEAVPSKSVKIKRIFNFKEFL